MSKRFLFKAISVPGAVLLTLFIGAVFFIGLAYATSSALTGLAGLALLIAIQTPIFIFARKIGLLPKNLDSPQSSQRTQSLRMSY